MKVTWSVKEDKRITRLLSALPKEATDLMKRAIASSGNDLYDAMVQRVPMRTGKLREAIGQTYAKDGLVTFVGFSKEKFPKQWKLAGWRAHFTEFGTKGSSGGGGASKGGRIRRKHAATPAHPFVLPALIEKGPEIIELHKDALDQALALASQDAGPSEFP
jgi:HK97 gp10 family phage protein